MTPMQVIHKWADIPFAYGADCCQLAGELIESLTGVNPMQRFAYASEAEAYAIINGYGSLEAAIDATLGPSKAPQEAVDGDAVIVDQVDGTQIAGAVYRGRIAVRTRKGVTDWPLGYARRAWSCHKP